MYILLRNLGFEPTMVAPSASYDLYFIKKYLNIREIKNFSEINENDYDILMVNSDQTWSARFRYLLNIGFLYFARNWSIVKFTYGTSLGSDSWNVPASFLSKAIKLVKNFKSISVREQNAIKIIQHYLGVKPATVKDWFNGRSRKKEREKFNNPSEEQKSLLVGRCKIAELSGKPKSTPSN